MGLYLDPPDAAMVLCVDEKSQMQALDRTAPLLPMMPGGAGAADPRLRASRHHQPVRGARHGHRQSDRPDPAPAPPSGVPAVPQDHRRNHTADLDLHLILDNYATHKTPQIQQLAGQAPAVPSALHPDRTVLAQPGRTLVRRLTNRNCAARTHRSVAALEADVQNWIDAWNADPKPFIWTKTADQILETIAAYCGRINDSGH